MVIKESRQQDLEYAMMNLSDRMSKMFDIWSEDYQLAQATGDRKAETYSYSKIVGALETLLYQGVLTDREVHDLEDYYLTLNPYEDEDEYEE